MARIGTTRRGLLLLGGLLMATMIVVGTVAVGFALNPASDEIVLVLDEDTSEFQYGAVTQAISVDESGCVVTADSVDGPIMELSGATYNKDGTWISDEVVGLHDHAPHSGVGGLHQGLGVNSANGKGNESCGLIESLNKNTTDALTLSLGSAADGQLIDSIDFDFDSKFDSRVRIDYLEDDTVLFTEYYDLPDDATEVNDFPHHFGAVRLVVPQDAGNIGTLFNGVRISMEDREITLAGGAAWPDPGAHRTVFHLTEATPEISIDSTTNGTDGAAIIVGEPITWSNHVTNIGPIALHDVEVVDTKLGTIPCLLSDLLPGESTTCSIDGIAVIGEFANEATVSGTTPGGAVATATDGSSYFGVLGCGDSDSNGGPGFEDDPLGAFFNGPTKGEAECGAAVVIETTNTTGSGGDQTVNVAAPPGFVWDGVTGLVTIEWDVETPDDDGIARTLQQLIPGDPLSEIVIPWCDSVVGIAHASAPDWWYELDPDTTYPTATGSGDTCLIKQTTETVDVGGVVHTQTTEVFYIWNDPLLVRK